ncbi:YncE family protein [Vallitalea maricola]|uniref:Uncharacterized protein n=1 Tax=Vallitalea maricola TaxID=3074433 RepID=A0ACB5UKW2_9FIRM|nr:hypothetical protein AN2V17_28300 [Vallitalea sp. AN17-2]
MKEKYIKNFLVIFLSCILIVLVGCNSTKVSKNTKINDITEDSNYSYRIYGLSGMNIYMTNLAINKEKVVHDKPKKIEMASIGYLSMIRELPDKSIICAFELIKKEVGHNIYVINNDEIVSYEVFDDITIASNIIVDKERNLVYFMGRTQDKNVTPLGTPIDVVDLCDKEVVDRLYFKGELYGCTMNDNYIYLSILLGKSYGYDEVEEAYISRINRETREYEIVTKKGLDYGPIDVFATKDNSIYDISCINPRKDGGVNEPKISKYNQLGEFQGEYDIPLWCDGMLLDDNGVIYVNHVGKEFMSDYEGEIITIFDTKEDKIVDTLQGFEGCSCIDIEDNYLFVANYLSGDVSILDKDSRKEIGKVNLEDVGKLRQIVVVKVSN